MSGSEYLHGGLCARRVPGDVATILATHIRHAERLGDDTGSLLFSANFTKATFAPVRVADKGSQARITSVGNLSVPWLLFERSKMW